MIIFVGTDIQELFLNRVATCFNVIFLLYFTLKITLVLLYIQVYTPPPPRSPTGTLDPTLGYKVMVPLHLLYYPLNIEIGQHIFSRRALDARKLDVSEI